MKIKIDENLPESIGAFLVSHGHDVHTVRGEQLGGEPDGRVWGAAQAEERFFITQDLDFSDVIYQAIRAGVARGHSAGASSGAEPATTA